MRSLNQRDVVIHQWTPRRRVWYAVEGTVLNVIGTTERWLVAVVGAYGIVFVGYGHSGLPLGFAVPVVWVNWQSADLAIAGVAGLAAVGVLATTLTFLVNAEGRPWWIYASIAVMAFGMSDLLAIAISEIPLFTTLSSTPLIGCVFGLVRRLMRVRLTSGVVNDHAG